MSEMIKERVNENLARLRLSRIQEVVDELIKQAQDNNTSYLDLLDRLFAEEVSVKEDRRIKTTLLTACLPFEKTVDEYDFGFHPDLDKRSVMNLFDLEFIQKKENIIFLGPPGVGKSHLAVALAIKAAQFGKGIYFTTMADLMIKLKNASMSGKTGKGRSYHRSDLVIVDEVGYMPVSRQDAHLFFQFVCYRYERSSTIFTSNKSFTEWGELLGDPVIATAVLDRILHHCHVINIKGNSYRLKQFHPKKDDPA